MRLGIDVDFRDSISRALNVMPIEMCPSSRCPVRRPRLYCLSWKLPVVGHCSIEHAKRVDTSVFQPCKKRATSRRLDQPRMVSHGKRTVATSDTYRRKTASNSRFCRCFWQDGLTNSETWRCPDADERERLLSFRPDHSRPAVSTSAKKMGAGKRSICVCHDLRTRGCSRICSQSCSAAYKFSANPGIDIIREVFRREKHAGREVRRFWSSRAPRRVAAQHTPSSRVEMEKNLWLCPNASGRAHQRVGTSSSHQWGPVAFTVRIKHSSQRSPCNGFHGDLGSFGTRALRIAAPRAIGHEVRFACGRSIFHPTSRVMPDGLQSGRWSQSAMPKNHQRGALGEARRKRL